MAQWPECEEMLDLDADEVEEGDLVSCPECSADLEVVHTNPVELDLADDEKEDSEEDDEEDLDDEDLDSDEEEDDEEEDAVFE